MAVSNWDSMAAMSAGFWGSNLGAWQAVKQRVPAIQTATRFRMVLLDGDERPGHKQILQGVERVEVYRSVV